MRRIKCPECDAQQPHQIPSDYEPVTCRKCSGKGWIDVLEDCENVDTTREF
jgi:RecJ-like exonuclease